MSPIPRVSIFGVALALAACGPAIRAEPPLQPDGERIYTATDIDHMRVATAWDVLERTGFVDLRESVDGSSATVRTRRGKNSILLISADEPVFILDGVRLDDVRVLRQVAARTIQQVRLVTGIQATVQQGTNSGAGLVDITTKSAPDST